MRTFCQCMCTFCQLMHVCALFISHSPRFCICTCICLQLEDVQGLPSGLCNKGVGSLVGACPWCKTTGVRMHGTTKYFGAITHTPTGCPIRADFAAEFKEHDEIKVLAKKRPAPARTDHEAIASGRKMKRAKADANMTKTAVKELQKTEPFTDVDVWSERFDDWSKLGDTIVDPAHEILNLIKDIIHLITSMKDSSMAFTKARRAEEKSLGRFVEGKVLETLRFVIISLRFVTN